MAAVLQQVLERAELAKLPKPVQGKLERFLADQQTEIDGLRARHERFKVDSGECGAVLAGNGAVGPPAGAEGGGAGPGGACVSSERVWGLTGGYEGGCVCVLLVGRGL